jgi:hypothetical protein
MDPQRGTQSCLKRQSALPAMSLPRTSKGQVQGAQGEGTALESLNV